MAILRRLGWSAAGLVGLVGLALAAGLILDWRSLLADRIARMATASLGRTVLIEGAVKLGLWREGPSLILKDVRLLNAAWASAPDMVTVERLEARVRLGPLFAQAVEVDTLALRNVSVLIETNYEGQSNRPRPGRLRMTDQPLSRFTLAGPQTVVVRNADLRYRAPDGAELFAATIERGLIEPALRGLRLELFGTYRKALVALEGTLADPLALIRAEATPVEFAAAIGKTTVLIAGDLGSPFRGPGFSLELDGKAPHLGDLAGLFGLAGFPEDSPAAFSLALRGEGQSIAIDELSASLAGGTLVGAGEAQWDDDGLNWLDGVLAADSIDIAALAGPWVNIPWPDDLEAPLPLDRLRQIHIDLSLQAESLRFRGAQIESVDARALLANGVLTVFPVTARYRGAPVDGELSADFSRDLPHAEVRLSSQALDLGVLLAEAGVKPWFSGALDVAAELRSRGTTLADLTAGLEGEAAAVLASGTLDPRYLAEAPESWRQALSAMGEGTEFVPLTCVLARVRFGEGRAETRALKAETELLHMGGQASLDLVTGALDLVLSPRPRTVQKPAAIEDLTAQGTLRNPQFGLAPEPGARRVTPTGTRCDLGLAGVLVPRYGEEPTVDPETAEALRAASALAGEGAGD